MKPSKQQHDAAVMQGIAARQCGRKQADCPFRESATEPLRTLRDAWMQGHQQPLERRR